MTVNKICTKLHYASENLLKTKCIHNKKQIFENSFLSDTRQNDGKC